MIVVVWFGGIWIAFWSCIAGEKSMILDLAMSFLFLDMNRRRISRSITYFKLCIAMTFFSIIYFCFHLGVEQSEKSGIIIKNQTNLLLLYSRFM